MDTATRRIRDRLGMSREELGAQLQVSQATVWKWETGRAYPRVPLAWGLLDLAHRARMRMRLEDIYPRPDG